MIIDTHYHQIPAFPEEMLDNALHDPMRCARLIGRDIGQEDLRQAAIDTWSDPDGQKLIAGMDEAGIDFTMVCAVDPGIDAIDDEVAQFQNKMVADVAAQHKDRVIALAGLDPRRGNAPDMLKECLEQFGMRGLKYHADNGFDPSGAESYRLLGIVEKAGGILLSHTGPLPPPSRCKYADTKLLADLAVDFPDLRVIAAHMGYVDWRPWAALATHQPNLYGDLAMWDAYAFGRYELFCRELRDLIDFAGIEKVLFGTDDPIFRIVRPTREWIELIENLPRDAPKGIEFSEEEVKAILGGNAASLLGLGG